MIIQFTPLNILNADFINKSNSLNELKSFMLFDILFLFI